MGTWKDKDGKFFVYPRENKGKAIKEELARLLMLEQQCEVSRRFILRLQDSELVEEA